jgi:hypothetical protein
MPTLPKEEAAIVKAQIYDLSEQACKQALFAMVEIFKEHPSIFMVAFRLLIEDATKLTNMKKVNQRVGVA